MAGTDWLDDLTRGVSQAATRRDALRAAIAALIAGLAATFSPPLAPSKRNTHKRKRRNKRKHHKKKGQRKPAQTGHCTFDQTAEGSFLLVEVEDTFENKPLTLTHQVSWSSAGDVTQQTVIKLGPDLVLQFDADNPDETTSRLRARYGIGFHGIEELGIVIIDGKTIGGSINGRELVSRPVEDVKQNPDGWQFVDGGPPPVAIGDPGILPALQSVLDRAGQEAAHCAGGQANAAGQHGGSAPLLELILRSAWLGDGSASAKESKRNRHGKKSSSRNSAKYNPSICEEVSIGCMICWGGCFATMTACCFWTFGLGCVACYVAYEECLDACDASACCPVECGSDLPSSCCCEDEKCCDGDFCCKKDETCCEDTCCTNDEACFPGGVCCQKGVDFCLGNCCPKNTFCKEGICCHEKEEPCFGECCPAGDTCREEGLCCPEDVADCAGICCPSEQDSCQGTVCCPLGQVVCGGTCCAPDDICKPPEVGSKDEVCCPHERICGQICCDELSRCTDPESGTCCSFTSVDCDGVCCDVGEVCLSHLCCPGGQVCGDRCCPDNNYCADEAAMECKPCAENENPCPISVKGAPHCCPKETLCCGDGTCCQGDIPCCDNGDGPKCDPSCLPK